MEIKVYRYKWEVSERTGSGVNLFTHYGYERVRGTEIKKQYKAEGHKVLAVDYVGRELRKIEAEPESPLYNAINEVFEQEGK